MSTRRYGWIIDLSDVAPEECRQGIIYLRFDKIVADLCEFRSAKLLSRMESIRNKNAIATKTLLVLQYAYNCKDTLQSDASIRKHNANFECMRENAE